MTEKIVFDLRTGVAQVVPLTAAEIKQMTTLEQPTIIEPDAPDMISVKSPDGTAWNLTVDDDGSITVAAKEAK